LRALLQHLAAGFIPPQAICQVLPHLLAAGAVDGAERSPVAYLPRQFPHHFRLALSKGKITPQATPRRMGSRPVIRTAQAVGHDGDDIGVFGAARQW
jgi:hypothetical protein